jgi:alpha 1,2-mannosyltransferase
MHYDWVFLNDKEFDRKFKRVMTDLVSGTAKFGKITDSQWSYPPHIDLQSAAQARQKMKEENVIYGDSVSYRHMCRYQSGFFFRHPLMMDYDWYWRVEPGVEFFCDMPEDPFRTMLEGGKKYGFVISLLEYQRTIPTLWETVRNFMEEHPEHIAEGNMMDFVSDDGGFTYNLCHFVSHTVSLSLHLFPSFI